MNAETIEEQLRAAIRRIYQARVYQNGRKCEGISLAMIAAIHDAAEAAGLTKAVPLDQHTPDPHDDHLVSLMDWERG